MAVVIKAFPCSFDGIHSEMLEVGDERDFGFMTDGLVAAGYVVNEAAGIGGMLNAEPVAAEVAP
ncbi:MAG: hypothetical protein ACLGIM_10345, partial [Alphaproteobacteria bacterium]